MQPSEPKRELEQSKMCNTLNSFQCCGGSYEIPIFNIDQRAYSHVVSLVILWYKYHNKREERMLLVLKLV